MRRGRLGVLVGGGPAPGINAVIDAVTAGAARAGVDLVGIEDGFHWLMRGETARSRRLLPAETGPWRVRGGSLLGTSRANPAADPEHLAAVAHALRRLEVSGLVTIGGDDTASSAMRLAGFDPELRVVHVPKTIDNDLDLGPGVDTFGFQSARHVGAELAQNLVLDAQATARWYLVVAMGRAAGHLAHGIGSAAGATLTIVPEEASPAPLALEMLVDTVLGAMLKRLASGRQDGVAVLAEGLGLLLRADDVAELKGAERDAHGHVRLAEVGLARLVTGRLRKELKALGVPLSVTAKDIGYELRAADPIPLDVAYASDLGAAACEALLVGRGNLVASMHAGRYAPIEFDALLDAGQGRARTRRLDTGALAFRLALQRMTRVEPQDLEPPRLQALAQVSGLSAEAFRRRFERVARGAASEGSSPEPAAAGEFAIAGV